MATAVTVTSDTLITIKVSVGDNLKKLKLPLADLTPQVLPQRLTALLDLKTNKSVRFERFSDSAGGYVFLDPTNAAVYKTLVRAAKAKLKLRLRASYEGMPGKTPPSYNGPEQAMAALIAARNRDAVPPLEKARVAATLEKMASAPTMKSVPTGLSKNNLVSGHSTATAAPPAPAQMAKNHEAPVPLPFFASAPPSRLPGCNHAAKHASVKADNAIFPAVPAFEPGSVPTWSVYCNNCDKALTGDHFHCSICDQDDYDLCQQCVDAGVLCSGQDHWLIKRFVKDGIVVSSTTERISPRKARTSTATISQLPVRSAPAPCPIVATAIPGAFENDSKISTPLLPTRTCNNCIDVWPEDQFFTCADCDDFDLCKGCFNINEHGHHPAHVFAPAVEGQVVSASEAAACSAGRNTRHVALCDVCDKSIDGMRHKCFDCPDYDLCNDCFKNARINHPGHRFASLAEPIQLFRRPAVVHHGIYCDGAACTSQPKQRYIIGIRYKCAICPDHDLCANCEALPLGSHNQTHPLLKIRTPLRQVSISTTEEQNNGATRHFSTASMRDGTNAVNAAVQRAALERKQHIEQAHRHRQAALQRLAVREGKAQIIKKHEAGGVTMIEDISKVYANLEAHYVGDTIPDGIRVRAETRFTQVWTLKNAGPASWPAGCSVRFIGGDNMLNFADDKSFSSTDMAQATESNVTGCEVRPGETVAFKVVLKAPKRAGRAISYWRLKTHDGLPFGHRLWCDVDVQSVAEWSEGECRRAADVSSAERPASHESSAAAGARAEQSAVGKPASPDRSKTDGMVFPTLEQESPASSTIISGPMASEPKAKVATAEDEETGNVEAAVAPEDKSKHTLKVPEKTQGVNGDVFEDISDEIEILSANGTFSDDDGFLTDEEYDILDASDQETVASSK